LTSFVAQLTVRCRLYIIHKKGFLFMIFPKNISRAAIDKAARKMIAHIFNEAAGAAARFEQVPLYHPDWDNLANDGFIRNAGLSGMRCLASGSFAPDARGNVPGHVDVKYSADEGLRGVSLRYAKPDGVDNHDARLREVLAFAREWRSQQQSPFSEPRLIELPSLKCSALWLAGPRDVFIPVAEFHTKAGDPIAVDDKYLDKLRAKHAEMLRMYKDADGLSPPGG
jgi:hypothetical protein